MKNSIKRAQSRAGSSFAERENQRSLAGGKSNFRPKVKQLKKTLLTLVALLAVTTGAWADETLLLTIESTDYQSFKSGSQTFDDKVTVTFSNEVKNDGDNYGWYAGGTGSLLTVAGINGCTITSCKFYTPSGTANTGYPVEVESPSVYIFNGRVYADDSKSVQIGFPGVTKIEVYGTAPGAASATPVDDFAWDAEAKTGTFTMPGGNVTLEPEYYPQATVADGGVTAADADARATTDDPLVKVDATKLTGAKKLMYFVSNSGTAPAYDAEGWTDQLPTAEGFTQQGIVYVWYYPVGTDEGVDGATATYSDGDICLQSITARIAAAPTYAVEFAEGTEESDKWTASPNTGVKKGTEVTVTYTGTKKVIGVKAEKKEKASAPSLNITNPVVGQVIGSDGKNYAYGSLPTGVTAVAKICYVSGSNGLALALTDEDGKMNWSTAMTTCAAHTPAFTGGTWKLATQAEWNNMISAIGSYEDLRDGFGFVGGTNMQSGNYWSSTESGSDDALYYDFADEGWYNGNQGSTRNVRACLAF